LPIRSGCAIVIKGRFNDDYAGIAAMFAGLALAGRWLHLGIRLIRVKQADQDSTG
jgi:hypothetical protein